MIREVGWDAGCEVLGEGGDIANACMIEQFCGEGESFRWEGGRIFRLRSESGRRGLGIWHGDGHFVLSLRKRHSDCRMEFGGSNE